VGEDLERLLRERGGVVLRDELLAIGIGQDQLYRQLRSGVWRARGRKVVVHATAREGLLTDSIVAGLLCSGAILTGPSAALIRPNPAWAGRTFRGHRAMLIAPRSSKTRPWLTVRHPGAQSDVVHGLRIATAHTILVDLLRFLPWSEAAAIAGAAHQHRVTSPEKLEASTNFLRGAAGAPQLKRLVRAMLDGAESGPEIDLHEALRSAQIRGWVANRTVSFGGRLLRPDVVFPNERIAVEYDGMTAHAAESIFHTDRDRIRDMQFSQWLVLPITKRTLYADVARRDFLGALQVLIGQRRAAAPCDIAG